jgi:sugar/nucleoside kinase (ribokinase family)
MEQSHVAEVVSFGMLTPVEILVVDRLPEHNTGAFIRGASDFIFDDAAIVACLLRQWDVQSGLIGTAVGDDYRGRNIAHRLKALGVLGKVRRNKNFRTPLEVDISDATGARTYFWQRDPEVLDTLDTADLSLIKGARLLYVDWYDGDHILRAMDEAIRLEIPVFLNLEHGHENPDILRRYAGRATICQAVTDAAQKDGSDPLKVAYKLLDVGVKIVLITLASEGALIVTPDMALRVGVIPIQAVDGCGAGATFATGFIYGYLHGWPLEAVARFATVAAGLKVAQVGLKVDPVDRIQAMAATVDVQPIELKAAVES